MIEEARRNLAAGRVRPFRFEVGETPEDEKGICGGSVELFLEAFDTTALPLWEELSQATGNDEGGVLVSILSRDGPPRKMLVPDVDRIDAARCRVPTGDCDGPAGGGRIGPGRREYPAGGMDVFIEPLAVQPSVVLFGAGHVSYHIARFAKSVHFRVTVCDDRSEYANESGSPMPMRSSWRISRVFSTGYGSMTIPTS